MKHPTCRERNFLTAVAVARRKIEAPDAHRFSVPAIGVLHEIEFTGAVAFLHSRTARGS